MWTWGLGPALLFLSFPVPCQTEATMWVRKLTAVTGVAASPGASVSIKDGDQTQGTAEVSANSVLRSHPL